MVDGLDERAHLGKDLESGLAPRLGHLPQAALAAMLGLLGLLEGRAIILDHLLGRLHDFLSLDLNLEFFVTLAPVVLRDIGIRLQRRDVLRPRLKVAL